MTGAVVAACRILRTHPEDTRMPAAPELAALGLAEHIRAAVEQAPAPSPEQMQRLRELLPPPRTRPAREADPVEIEQIAA